MPDESLRVKMMEEQAQEERMRELPLQEVMVMMMETVFPTGLTHAEGHPKAVTAARIVMAVPKHLLMQAMMMRRTILSWRSKSVRNARVRKQIMRPHCEKVIA